MLASGARAQHRCVKLTSQSREERGCRSVELRALCNEVPRTPPGPEGSNGIGIASGAADHPKFLAPQSSLQSAVLGRKPSSESVVMISAGAIALLFFMACGVLVFFCVLASETEREFEIA